MSVDLNLKKIGLFQGEQGRGIFGYLIASLIAYYLNILVSTYTKLTITQSTFLAVYVIGNMIIYSSDILFAKESFFLSKYKGINNYFGPIPYADLKTRAYWLLHSFYKKYFFRFIVTVIIDTIVGLTLLRLVIQKLDSLNILTKWKYRNHVVAWIVAAITYLLYLSTLRFKWAYQYEENPLMNVLVMAWLSLAILVSASTYSLTSEPLPKWRNMY